MKQYGDRDADQDDASLVASVLAGEREAFDMLLQRYSDSRNDLSGPTSLANERELRRQLGHQPQDISAVPYIEKQAIRQEQREEISARRIDAGRIVVSSGDGWRLVIFVDRDMRDMKEERRQHIHQAWRELLRDMLAQKASD